MNLALTLVRKGKSWSVLTLPQDGTLSDQIHAFHKELISSGKYDEVQVWSSARGSVKKRLFNATDGTRVRTHAELVAIDAKEDAKRKAASVKAEVSTKKVQTGDKKPKSDKSSDKSDSTSIATDSTPPADPAKDEQNPPETSGDNETSNQQGADLLS